MCSLCVFISCHALRSQGHHMYAIYFADFEQSHTDTPSPSEAAAPDSQSVEMFTSSTLHHKFQLQELAMVLSHWMT